MPSSMGKLAEPPHGSPWDEPIDRAHLVFVDLEMTGLNAKADRVIELCLERVSGETVVDRMESLVRPVPLALGAQEIHGIDEHALAGAPTFGDLASRVLALLEGAVLVAHAAEWDVAFLEAEFARAGHPVKIPFYLDTLTLSRRAQALASHSLDALRKHYGLGTDGSHRAGSDVRAMRAVWGRLVQVLTPATPRDLYHVRIGQKVARPEVLAAVEKARTDGQPVWVVFRPSRGKPQEFCFCVTGLRSDLDPPHVLGYQLPGRGQRELRADRILSVRPFEEPQHDAPHHR